MTVYLCDQKTPDCAIRKLYPSGTALNGCGTWCQYVTNKKYAKVKGDVPRTFIVDYTGILKEVEPLWKEDTNEYSEHEA